MGVSPLFIIVLHKEAYAAQWQVGAAILGEAVNSNRWARKHSHGSVKVLQKELKG